MASKPTKKPVKKITVKKISDSDKKIPRSLIIQYGDTHYILKAGLEWKANDLFGGAGYSIKISPIRMDYENSIFIFKALLTVLENGAIYVNYGEATARNVNKMMQSQLLHLAVTRAECRVLRMATACGYASYDEVKTMNDNGKAPIVVQGGDRPVTDEQKATIKALGGKIKKTSNKGEKMIITKQEASDYIKLLVSTTNQYEK